MKKVNGYVSVDGRFFETEEECRQYEIKEIPFRYFGTTSEKDSYEECSVIAVNKPSKAFRELSDIGTGEGIEDEALYFYEDLATHGEWVMISPDVFNTIIERKDEIHEVLKKYGY